jgi:hypothetical protein
MVEMSGEKIVEREVEIEVGVYSVNSKCGKMKIFRNF